MKKIYGLIVIAFLIFMAFIFSSCSSSSTPPPLTVFVTSATGDGNLGDWTDAINAGQGAGGLAAGDAICQARATAAGLPGTYKAWLSTTTTDAYCHIQGYDGITIATKCGQATLPVAAGPWVRTDGYPFAGTIDKLINNGQVFAPVMYDETGTIVTAFAGYFTGTWPDGTYDTQTCADWTSNSSSDNAQSGMTAGATYWWTEVTSSACNATYSLLCFQTGTGGPLPSITAPPSSKKVFVTSVTGNGNLTT